MAKEIILGLIGGLGFFLFGMKLMSEGLRKVAGDRLKKILHLLARTPVLGVLLGAAVTALIQSSSATSVLVIGFANAALLTLKQGISIIIGANIGTTFTAWLVSFLAVFKITTYALPAVGIGFAGTVLGRSRSAKMWGQVLMGFGILFVGLSIMKDVFEPLKESEEVRSLFVNFSQYPILGVLVGTLITMMLQSSSATIALVQILAFNGVISFPAAIPLILGDNIGTTITAQIAAVGGTVSARRIARAHLMFNVIGVLYMLIFIYNGLYIKFIDWIVPGAITGKNIMIHIALAHSVFNIVNAGVFLPFISRFERLIVRTVKEKPGAVAVAPQYLEEHLLATPPLAFEQTIKEVLRMIGLARCAVADAMSGFFNNDWKTAQKVAEKEEAVDNLQMEITRYLVELSRRSLAKEEAQRLPVLLHTVNDIERIGDHAENLVELVERKMERKLIFSAQAIDELKKMYVEVDNMVGDVVLALRDRDMDSAKRALKREETLNRLQIELRQSHVRRLEEGKCQLLSGLVFLDFVQNLEKIGDHLTNIAQSVLGGLRWDGEKS